jgi:hypothetical protein
MSEFQLPSRIANVTKDFYCFPLSADAPEVSKACADFIAKWQLPADSKPAAENWFGVYYKLDLLLVVGERKRDDTLEVTDLYPVTDNHRLMTMAVYATLNTYKMLLQLGVYKHMICTCLKRNVQFQNAVQRVFGIEPAAVIYIAETTAA